MFILTRAGLQASALALVLLLSDAPAWAGPEQEAAAKLIVEPMFPLWLARTRAWTNDVQEIKAMTNKATKGLAAVLPPDCDAHRIKKDVCGIRSFNVPSASMAPALQIDEVFLALTDFSEPPVRGEILVANISFRGSATTAVKRLIGLPGDRIELKGGQVFINGKAVKQTTTGTRLDTESGSRQIGQETLPNGRSYSILVADEKPPMVKRDYGPLTVPEDCYFVMGDNRDSSVDSRYPEDFAVDGFVHRGDIIGRAVVIAASPQRERAGMVFQPVEVQ